MALNLKYQTKQEFATKFWLRLRDAYESGDKLVYHRMVYWLYMRVQEGDFTTDQVRLTFNNTFGKSLNPAQWNTFVQTRLLPIKDRYETLLAEADLWQ